MAAIPSFEFSVLERICEVLADTSTGLTGSEIGKFYPGSAFTIPCRE
jgi:hypothetical protein